ncbi:hypothetical protein B0T20DRAFT_366888 [Sordaria brevicollis]|uniref:Uncharacterized protein n=1 Tax=Sordaria brevicollis TaxID=83679 RepID=A0AAE0PMQ1_SORBR|nr:hypothetical protein B0T20DRAFT_366888 [Sordaria brevicollis]
MSDSDTQPLLRILTAITFIPSLPLCITHGVLSHNPIPAVGLAPMALSAGYSVLLLTYRRRSKRKQNHRRSIGHAEEDNDLESVRNGGEEEEAGIISTTEPLIEGGGGGGGGGGAEDPEYPASERSQAEQTPNDAWEEEAKEQKIPLYAHTIFIFLVDTILAAGVMVVLVFTWINTQKGRTGITNPVLGGKLAMLAAYATIPLLANFLIHTYLALRGFAIGLALYPLIQYGAWHTLPPDCPNCSSRLRPASRPKIPWYDYVSRPKNLGIRRPSFKAPRWWSERQQRRTVVDVVGGAGSVDEDATTARLFVRNDNDLESVSHLGDEGVVAVAERYRDEPEDDVDEDAEVRSYRDDEREGEENDRQEREQEGQEQSKKQTEDLLEVQKADEQEEGQQGSSEQQQQREQDNDARSERLERIESRDRALTPALI